MRQPFDVDPPLLLASASPRRRRLFEWFGVPFEVMAVDTPEDLDSPLRGVPPVLARSIAAEKAVAARERAGDEAAIVTCDTIVVHDRRIMGKPADVDDAFAMLRTLSGREHEVVTGVAVLLPGSTDPRTFAVTTPVTMSELDDGAIAAWADEGELLGCAGAYNIERHLASVAPGECFQNVAGLPLCHLFHELVRDGFRSLASPVAACDAARCTTCALGPRIAVTRLPGAAPR